MTREEKYDAVNQCKSFKELAQVIRSFADSERMIQGKTRKFPADEMASACEMFSNLPNNVLTREFGIRQQAMMIEYYYENARGRTTLDAGT